MVMRQPPRETYKALLFNYDQLVAASEQECCYSLSSREVDILLAQIDYVAWKTRYQPTDTEIETETILRWHGELARKLMSGCCPDEGKVYRFTEDGELESSIDGGETWTPAPEDDPRLTAPLFPPLTGEDGDGKKCTAANNAAGQIHQMADQLIADAAVWSNLTGFIAALLGILAFLSIIGSGGLLTPLVVGLAGSLIAAGSAAFAAAMTEDVYERLVCNFYCNMQADGSFTTANIAEIKGQLGADEGGVAFQYLLQVVTLAGPVGLTNMGRTSGFSIDFDCTECEACDEGCAEKYRIWTQSAGDWGVIVDSGVDWFDVEIAASGFAIVEAIVGTECCEGLTVETLSGTGTQSAYLPCGTEWTPGMPFVSATIVDHCINAIEYQGTPGTIIRTTLTPCA